MRGILLLAVLSLFLLFSFQTFSAEKNTSVPSILHRALVEADIHSFRIEIGKLLDDPAPDFFENIATYLKKKDKKGFPVNDPSSINKVEDFAFEHGVLLLAAITLPLGKKNRDGLTAKDSASFEGNKPIDAILEKYNNAQSHELYGKGEKSVWQMSHLSQAPQDSPWAKLSEIYLPDTPPVKALLDGDIETFQKHWKALLAGPARDMLALLHSQGEEGKTFFHYASKFRPKHLQGIDREDLTSEQEREINRTQEILSNDLQELLQLFPEQDSAGTFDLQELLQLFPEQDSADTLFAAKLRIGATGTLSAIGLYHLISSTNSLTTVLSGAVSIFFAYKAVKCYRRFKK